MNREYKYDNQYELYEDFEQEVRASVNTSVNTLMENIDRNYCYVPFHIHDKYYMLKHSDETIGVYVKCWEVVEVELIEIHIKITETTGMDTTLHFKVIKDPETFLTAKSYEYSHQFFKSMKEAELECKKVNDWLKMMQEES